MNRDGPTFEIALELALHDECKGEYRLPSFASMFDQIEKWGYFGPLSGSKHLIYESLYKDLCEYVHVSRGSTDYSQAIVSKSEYQAYCSGKVDDDKLKRFLPLFDMTLNTVGAVFFTVVTEVFTLPGAAKATRKFMSEFKEEGESLISVNLAVEYAVS